MLDFRVVVEHVVNSQENADGKQDKGEQIPKQPVPILLEPRQEANRRVYLLQVEYLNRRRGCLFQYTHFQLRPTVGRNHAI